MSDRIRGWIIPGLLILNLVLASGCATIREINQEAQSAADGLENEINQSAQ